MAQTCAPTARRPSPIAALLALALTVATVAGSLSATADEAAPRAVVEKFYHSLMASMKDARKIGFDGRFSRMVPAVATAFNLPLMIRISVGSSWTSMPPDQQKRLTEAFGRYSAANYAANFNDFNGERFEITGSQPSQAGRVVVETKMVLPKDPPVILNYLLQPDRGNWQIIDIFLTGTISQLAANRSEYSSVVRREGAEGLISLFNKKVEDLRRTE